jgi:DNA/RNA endonuclease YhcR with UshA esterase domain
MERQEKQAIILLILVILMVSGTHMILSILGNDPFAAQYSPDVAEGRMVRLEGTVEKITTTQEGGHLILQIQGVQVFIPASAVGQHTIVSGAQIRVYGVVQTYRGEREVVVSRPSDIATF